MVDHAELALVALRRILRATEISSRALAKQSGLTPSQLILMQILSRRDGATPSVIAKEISLSQATVTAMIDKLEKRDLVRRRRDTEDKRRVFLELTSKGEATLSAAPGIVQERIENRFAKLADWEQTSLVAALQRIASMLDAEDLDAAPILDIGAIDEPFKDG